MSRRHMGSPWRQLSLFLSAVFLVSEVSANGFEIFSKNCPTSRCSRDGPEIRYPLFIKGSHHPEYCGLPGYEISCIAGSSGPGNQTVIKFPSSTDLYIAEINYKISAITLKDPQGCLMKSIMNLNDLFSSFEPTIPFYFGGWGDDRGILLRCSTNDLKSAYHPVPCMSGNGSYVFMSSGFDASARDLPVSCEAIQGRDLLLPHPYDHHGAEEITLNWRVPDNCFGCEASGGTCGFCAARNTSTCFPTANKGRIVRRALFGVTAAGFLLLMLEVVIFIIIKYKTEPKRAGDADHEQTVVRIPMTLLDSIWRFQVFFFCIFLCITGTLNICLMHISGLFTPEHFGLIYPSSDI